MNPTMATDVIAAARSSTSFHHYVRLTLMACVLLLTNFSTCRSDPQSRNNGAAKSTTSRSSSSSSSSSSAYEYVPITALNRYGESEQLRNARAASSRYGALVLVAVAVDDDDDRRHVVVCASLSDDRARSPLVVVDDACSSSLVRVVAVDHDDGGAATALAASGVRPDADVATRVLREHGRRTWERYDAAPTAERAASVLAGLLQNFRRRDHDDDDDDGDELVDGAGVVDAFPTEDGRRAPPLGRPLGIRAAVFGVRRRGAEAMLIAVEPSGARRTAQFAAMGRDSDVAEATLRRKWRRGTTAREMKELFFEVAREVRLKERGQSSSDDDDDDGARLVFEVLSTNGKVNRTYASLSMPSVTLNAEM